MSSELYLNDDFLEPWRNDLPRYAEIEAFRKETAGMLDRASVAPLWEDLDRIPHRPGVYDFSGDRVCFGEPKDLEALGRENLLAMLRRLMPWRKGPFDYFGIRIDAEWRSDYKWNRVVSGSDLELRGRRILDVGCNNLYYMYRMLPHQPELVVGIDPMHRYYFHHLLNQKFAPELPVHFELMGVDQLDLFPAFFDTVFFMGILYHRRNPIQSLERLNRCMRKNGLLILETAGIPGEDPTCLFPGRRYMKAPGYWFLPTVSAVRSMLDRTGFIDIEVFDVVQMSKDEQRRTEWAVFESLEHFLHPDDPSKTVEGYPAPIRIYLRARKR